MVSHHSNKRVTTKIIIKVKKNIKGKNKAQIKEVEIRTSFTRSALSSISPHLICYVGGFFYADILNNFE